MNKSILDMENTSEISIDKFITAYSKICKYANKKCGYKDWETEITVEVTLEDSEYFPALWVRVWKMNEGDPNDEIPMEVVEILGDEFNELMRQ